MNAQNQIWQREVMQQFRDQRERTRTQMTAVEVQLSSFRSDYVRELDEMVARNERMMIEQRARDKAEIDQRLAKQQEILDTL